MKGSTPKRERAYEKLREVTLKLADEVDPRNVVPLILDQAIALVGAERGFVVLTIGGRGGFEIAAARNLDREEIQQPEFKVSHSIAQRVAETGKSEVLVDAQEEARNVTSVRNMNVHSVLCVPLRAHGHTLGVVYVDHRFVKGEFGKEDLELLELFAVPAGIALESSRRINELRRAHDELVRRLATIERLRAEVVERYRERSREANRLKDESMKSAPREADGLPGIIVRSSSMLRLCQLVRKVAPSDVPVLVLGESGTGKERLARALHALSGRAQGPFVAENCAAIAETLLESELFGHEAGAFTGAVKAHAGLFETARGGTVFLDEIGEMSLGLQAKLLRVLQEKEIRRVGADRPIAIDVRIVAATNRDVEAMVATGQFRADLYYRLNVVRLEIPPLRDRPEDIPALIDHFLEKASADAEKVTIEPRAREILLSHSWPGNVRELENEVRRLAVLAGAGGTVRPGLISPSVLKPTWGGDQPAPPPAPRSQPAPGAAAPIDGIWRLEELEKEMISRALEAAGGNKTVAARLLGIPKSSLYHRLGKHGLSGSDQKAL